MYYSTLCCLLVVSPCTSDFTGMFHTDVCVCVLCVCVTHTYTLVTHIHPTVSILGRILPLPPNRPGCPLSLRCVALSAKELMPTHAKHANTCGNMRTHANTCKHMKAAAVQPLSVGCRVQDVRFRLGAASKPKPYRRHTKPAATPLLAFPTPRIPQ